MTIETERLNLISLTARQLKLGIVEIGYGVGKLFERNAYMTEAVRAICHWSKCQQEGLHDIAETEAEGISSQRILKRCGFKAQTREETI